MNVRDIKTNSDYPSLCEWWEGRHPIIPKEDIPPGGFMAYDGNKDIMAAWLILTNATFCYFKGVVSNPDSTWKQREDALCDLVSHASKIAKDSGYKKIISVPIKTRLAEKFLKAGFLFYPELTHMCEKEI